MYFSAIDCVDIARRSSARGRQTTVRWQTEVFIHTQLSLSRAYLALARLSCSLTRLFLLAWHFPWHVQVQNNDTFA